MPQPQQSPAQLPPAQSEAFVKHLVNATSVVQTWPAWKQQVLGASTIQAASSSALAASRR